MNSPALLMKLGSDHIIVRGSSSHRLTYFGAGNVCFTVIIFIRCLFI